MPLSEAEAQRQINHMIAFIQQEANEKADEINAKTEEEFNIEKGQLIQQQRQQIMDYYAKMERKVKIQRLAQRSNAVNQARIQILNAREGHFRNLLDDLRGRLGEITTDRARYKIVLKNLILEALYRTMETDIVLRCREVDLSLVEEIIDSCANQYMMQIGRDVIIDVDNEHFLPATNSGGVQLIALHGRITTTNTLESRLEMIGHELIPEIRIALFGKNPNRRYTH